MDQNSAGGLALETEAKYTIPDLATFERLREAASFGQYTHDEAKTTRLHDRYVDTPDHRFYNRKFACRLREPRDGGELLLTVKGLGAVVDDAVHNREEYQARVQSLDVSTWPDGKLKS